MSVGSTGSIQNSVLDLIGPKPSAPPTRGDVSRADGAESGRSGGFDQALRESSSPRPEREATPARERERAGQASAETTREDGAAESSKPERPAAEAGDAPHGDPDQERDAVGGESKPTEAGAEADGDADEPSQDELAAEVEGQAARALVGQVAQTAEQSADKPGGSETSTQDAEQAKQAAAASKQQAQAGLAQVADQAGVRSQGPTATQAQATSAAAAQTVQPTGTQAEADTGDTPGGDTKATAQPGGPTASASGSASNASPFTLPDQANSEARLPVNAASATQQADATKAVLAQPMGGQSDDDAVNTSRLTRGLANAVQQRGGAVTLRLTPPEMGTVRIQMQITGTNVSASFHAESASAQTLLTQQLAQLRSSLESQGMNVERLSVQPLASASHSQNAAQSQSDQQQAGQQQQHSGANDGRSRGQYSGQSGGGRDGHASDDPSSRHDQPKRRGFFDQLSEAATPSAA